MADLRAAVLAADKGRVEALLVSSNSDSRGLTLRSEIDAVDAEGFTPLHWACAYGEAQIARLLVDAGASLAVVSSPAGLQAASSGSASPENKALLQPLRNRRQNTPLHAAVLAGSAECASVLLSSSPSATERDGEESIVSQANAWGETPLHLAASGGHADLALLLLKNSAGGGNELLLREDRWGRTPADVAHAHGWPLLAQSLGGTEEVEEGGKEETDSAKLLVDPDPEKATAALQALVQQQLEEDQKEQQKRQKQSNGGNDDEVKASLPTRALSKLMEAPLDEAAFERWLSQDEEIDATGKDFYGLAAVHKVASWNKPNALGSLLALHPDELFSLGPGGSTPLHMALESGAEQSALLLCERWERFGSTGSGSDKDNSLTERDFDLLSHRNGEGMTVLHLAVSSGSKKVVDRLVAAGADVHAPVTAAGMYISLSLSFLPQFISLIPPRFASPQVSSPRTHRRFTSLGAFPFRTSREIF
jgi:ankyrin repeat protein